MDTSNPKPSFAELLRQSDVPVLVDFWAEWCGPCRTLAPMLEQLQRELSGQLRIIKVNVDRNPAAASAYSVQGIPALLLFRGGSVVWRHAGVVPYAELKAAVAAQL
ncbi:MAG: thioredoxin [Bacteroidia bacterium]|nr:thioredoxin [Bacteroidia bacterium]